MELVRPLGSPHLLTWLHHTSSSPRPMPRWFSLVRAWVWGRGGVKDPGKEKIGERDELLYT